MTTLRVLRFATPDGATEVVEHLEGLKERSVLSSLDAAIIAWPEGSDKPSTRHVSELSGPDALDCVFWGLLFGVIFFLPLLDIGGATDVAGDAGALGGAGIEDNFVHQVQRSVTKNSSALFLLAAAEQADRLIGELRGRHLCFDVIMMDLPEEKEAELRALFASL